MQKCIEQIESLINDQVKLNRICLIGERFTEFQKTYFFTNENIKSYLDLVSFDGKSSALSVLSSGDQTFNLITKGIMDIDTFDTNKFTEYFVLGFKRAMILKYDYYSFKRVVTILRSPKTSLEIISEIVIDLLPYMDLNHRTFWRTIIDYNYKLQKSFGKNLNLFGLLTLEVNSSSHTAYLDFNNYLLDENQYNLLRKRLVEANITFTYADVSTIPNQFDKKYDFILLSNILDYLYKQWDYNWEYQILKMYEERLKKITNSEGIIFLHYIMAYKKNMERFRKEIINCSDVTSTDLQDEELIELPVYNSFTNGIILKRFK